MVMPINRGWLYSHSAEDGATGRDFDDAHFEHVIVPHTNVKLPWHGFSEQDYTFVSTYRRHFKLPQAASGRRVFVDFEGVMTASTVWLNGQKLGEYKGGYTPFSFELTPHLDPSGDNVLAVEVDSTERPDIPPFGHEVDYLTFGGIYREVALRVVLEVFIDNVFAAPKSVLTQPAVDVKCYLAHSENGGHGDYSLVAEVSECWAKRPRLCRQQTWQIRRRRTWWKFRCLRRLSSGIWSTRDFIPSACGCCMGTRWWTSRCGASALVKRPSPITASH